MKPQKDLQKLIHHVEHYKNIYPSVYQEGKPLVKSHVKKINKQIKDYS